MVLDENANSCMRMGMGMGMDGRPMGGELGEEAGVGISHADAAEFFSDAFPLSPCPISPRMQLMIEKHFCSSSSFSSASSASSSSSLQLLKMESGK